MTIAKMKMVKRFGPRYGLKPRRRLEEIERMYRHRRYKCPKCGSLKVRRVSAGIWQCEKCKFKFASGAYRVI